MWQDKLKEIIYLLENSNINEIEASFWGRKYRVVKHPSVIGGVAAASSETHAASPAAAMATDQVAATVEANNGEKILSPMPGTFYTASSPETPKFVKVGDKVSKGDTLCIIEAMKIMNEIEAEKDGIIKSVLVENGQPVEYDQPLFEID